jgi:hypothetical protein
MHTTTVNAHTSPGRCACLQHCHCTPLVTSCSDRIPQAEEKRRAAIAAAKDREAKAAARAAEREAKGSAAAGDAPAAAETGSGATAAEPPAAPVHPWAAQMAECDVLLAYLARLKPKALPPPLPSKPAATDAALKGPKGESLRARSDDGDDLAFLRAGPGAGAGGKKKQQRVAAAAAAAAAAAEGDVAPVKAAPLKFQLDALASFTLLDLQPPATTAELDAAIAAVAAKKEWFDSAPPPPPKAPAAAAGATAGSAVGRGGARGIGRGGGRGGGAAAAAATRVASPFAPGSAVSTPYGPGVVTAVRAGGDLVVTMSAFGAVGYLQADQVRLQ